MGGKTRAACGKKKLPFPRLQTSQRYGLCSEAPEEAGEHVVMSAICGKKNLDPLQVKNILQEHGKM